jgi:hypothetical protein
LLVSLHLLEERIAFRILPAGDEGSWMNIAAQVLRGEGFTTRWLEHPFLEPCTLPRPDDFRYPVPVLLLALSFKVFGVSYTTALRTIAFFHLLLLLLLFIVGKRLFSTTAALLTVTVTALSLLQLYWNTRVYIEAISACCFGGIILWTQTQKHHKRLYPVITGVLIGLFYCIRPNGILLFCAIPFLFGWQAHAIFTNRKALLTTVFAALLTMSPWLIRTAIAFGNPFHIATGAGLLRATRDDPLTLTTVEFFIRYGVIHILKAIVIGTWRLLGALHYFEHGLEIIPLLAFTGGIFYFRNKVSAFILCSFLVSFIACDYVAFNYSWAGVRYLSSFLPWIYLYGIHFLVTIQRQLVRRRKKPIPEYAIPLLLSVVLLAPVYYPHRYYERRYSEAPGVRKQIINTHARTLNLLLSAEDTYCAHRMAQLHFCFPTKCIGLHEFFDSSYVPMIIERFSPSLLVLTKEELKKQRLENVLEAFRREGDEPILVKETETACYYQLRKGKKRPVRQGAFGSPKGN